MSTARWLWLAAVGCGPEPGEGPGDDAPTWLEPQADAAASGLGGNVLVILADDLGVDKIGAWEEHPWPAPTPNIDALTESGVRFRHAFGQPICSPGRAALLTGRVAMRTGIGSTVRPGNDDFDLPDSEITLPEALRWSPLGPWSSAVVGKWHLSTLDEAHARGPLDHGFDRFLGLLENPLFAVRPDERQRGYDHWEKSTDGVLSMVDDYLLTTQTDDALEMMETLPEPWLLYVAYSGIHQPLHVPPEDLWSVSVPDSPEGQTDAMTEALDTEIGRLLAALDDHTTVVFTADNGTAGSGMRAPADPRRGKDTLYEGGVRVPLVIAGHAVETPGVTVDAMVHLVDVFATVLDLAGAPLSPLGEPVDATSLLPFLDDPGRSGRETLVIDEFPFNGIRDVSLDRSIRDDRWLLVRLHDAPEELYERFDGAPWQGPDLLRSPLASDAEEALARLGSALDTALPP